MKQYYADTLVVGESLASLLLACEFQKAKTPVMLLWTGGKDKFEHEGYVMLRRFPVFVDMEGLFHPSISSQMIPPIALKAKKVCAALIRSKDVLDVHVDQTQRISVWHKAFGPASGQRLQSILASSKEEAMFQSEPWFLKGKNPKTKKRKEQDFDIDARKAMRAVLGIQGSDVASFPDPNPMSVETPWWLPWVFVAQQLYLNDEVDVFTQLLERFQNGGGKVIETHHVQEVQLSHRSSARNIRYGYGDDVIGFERLVWGSSQGSLYKKLKDHGQTDDPLTKVECLNVVLKPQTIAQGIPSVLVEESTWAHVCVLRRDDHDLVYLEQGEHCTQALERAKHMLQFRDEDILSVHTHSKTVSRDQVLDGDRVKIEDEPWEGLIASDIRRVWGDLPCWIADGSLAPLLGWQGAWIEAMMVKKSIEKTLRTGLFRLF